MTPRTEHERRYEKGVYEESETRLMRARQPHASPHFSIRHSEPPPASLLYRFSPIGKIQHILCTGNVVDLPTYDFLKTIAADIHLVRGDMDDPYFLPGVKLPETATLQIGEFKIGLVHGHQVREKACGGGAGWGWCAPSGYT